MSGSLPGKCTDDKDTASVEALKRGDDLTELKDVSSFQPLLSTLQDRFVKGEVYTSVASILVALSPHEDQKQSSTDEQRRAYSSQRVTKPHPYKVANEAVKTLRSRGRQAIVLLGEAGSGKTETAKMILRYLKHVSKSSATSAHYNNVAKKLVHVPLILEAFGNAKTIANNNASRFGCLIQVYFDSNLQILGGRVNHFFPEASRVVRQQPGELNFHFFYSVCAGANKDKYHLTPQDYPSLSSPEEAYIGIDSILKAMELLQFTAELKERILSTAAAILHLGNVSFVEQGHGICVADEASKSLRWVAELLNVSYEDLHKELLCGQLVDKAVVNKNAFAKYLYEMMFEVIVAQCNEAIQTSNTSRALSIVDLPGFEATSSNSFEQLVINYTHDALQRTVRQQIFEETEYLDVKVESFDWVDPCRVVERVIFPEASVYSAHANDKFQSTLESKGIHFLNSQFFQVVHYAGEVSYAVEGFCHNAHNVLPPQLEDLGRQSIQLMRQCLRRSSESSVYQSSSLARSLSDFKAALQEVEFPAQSHYIFCIKSNNINARKSFDKELVQRQLQALDLLAVVKIQQQGYILSLEHKTFYDRYKQLSYNQRENEAMHKLLSPPPGQICADFLRRLIDQDILKSIQAFQTWPESGQEIHLDAFKIGATKVWLKNEMVVWLQTRLNFLQEQQTQRKRLEDAIQDKNTDNMMLIVNEAKAYLPPSDSKVVEAERLFVELNRVTVSLEKHWELLNRDDRSGIPQDIQVMIDRDIARARAAGLSENVYVLERLLRRIRQLLSEEEELRHELRYSDYDGLQRAFDVAKDCPKPLREQAERRLKVMQPIVEKLKQALANNDISGAIQAIQKGDHMQMVSTQLDEGRVWVKEALLKKLDDHKTIRALDQELFNSLNNLCSMQAQLALIRKAGYSDLDAEIHKRFKELTEFKQHLWSFLQLKEVNMSEPFDAIKACHLARRLSDVPQQELFEEEIKRAFQTRDEREKQLNESNAALHAALASKNLLRIRQVLEATVKILPQEVHDNAYGEREIIATTERHVRRLVKEKDVDKIDAEVKNDPSLLDGLATASSELAPIRTIFAKIRAAQQSGNIEDLASALAEAQAADIHHLPRVRKADQELSKLTAANEAFKNALESKNFDDMKVAFIVVTNMGVCGHAFSQFRTLYDFYIQTNGYEAETALIEMQAKLNKARRNCNWHDLLAALDEARKLSFAESGEEFMQCFENAQRLCEQLTSIVKELLHCMQSGAVSELKQIFEILPRTDTSDLPPIPVIQQASSYLTAVSRFEQKLQDAVIISDVDKLSAVFEEAKLLNLDQSQEIISEQLRQRFSELHKVNNDVRDAFIDWFNDLPKFFHAIKRAQDLRMTSANFREAQATAQQEVLCHLDLCVANALSCPVNESVETQLRLAVETATLFVDAERIANAQALLDLVFAARSLFVAYQSRDVDSAPRWISCTAEKLGKFCRRIPEISTLIQDVREWQAEAKLLQQDLERFMESKQADLVQDAMLRGEFLLPCNEFFQRVLQEHKILQEEVKRVELGSANTNDEHKLLSLVKGTWLHHDVRALRMAWDKCMPLLSNEEKLNILSQGGAVEDFESHLNRLKLEHQVSVGEAEKKLVPLIEWSQELNEARETSDLEALLECLGKHCDWKCEARTCALEWAEEALLQALNARIVQGSEALRDPNKKLQSTMVCLRDVIETTKKWVNQMENPFSLAESVRLGESMYAELGFRWRIKKAMECMDEDKLKIALTEYRIKFLEQDDHGWLAEARYQVAKIDSIRSKLNRAIASKNSGDIHVAILEAKHGKGSSWPKGSPLLPEDATLGEAEKALLDIRRPQDSGFTELRQELRSHNVKQEPATDTPKNSVKLSDIPAIWHAMVPLLSETKLDVQVTRGAHAALAALNDLYFMDNAEWREVRDDVRVGLIKETVEYGNTSVSMGLAQLYFERYAHKRFVGFMNCGTGGVKYQLYAKSENGIVVALGEYKPGQRGKSDPATLAKLLTLNYVPKKGPVHDAAFIREAMVLETASAPWNNEELTARFFIEVPEVFAFVTGNLRNHYEERLAEYIKNPSPSLWNELQTVQNDTTSVFAAVGDSAQLAKPVSELLELKHPYEYLIPQEEEARMEALATRTLYSQMYRVLPKNAENEELEPIVSFGIGVSSTQFSCCTNPKSLTYHVGMQEPAILFIGERIVAAYLSDKALLDSLIAAIKDCKVRDTFPTIALKSGCLLPLHKPLHPAHNLLKAALRLVPAPKTGEEVAIIAARSETNEEIKMGFTLPTTLPELCAQAAALFRSQSSDKQNIQFIKAIDAKSKKVITDLTITKSLAGLVIQFIGPTAYQDPTERMRAVYFEDLAAHVSAQCPEWSNNSPKPTSQTIPCIPLCWLPDKWHAVKDRLGKGKDQDENEKILGTQASLSALKDMCYIPNQEWESCLRNIQVGIIKSTPECGNSSVSMGLAVRFFADKSINIHKSRVVGLLNCGTGGVKFQLYTDLPQRDCSHHERVALVAEFKPGKVSFARLEIDSPSIQPPFKPSRPVCKEKLQKSLRKWLACVPWGLASWPTTKVPIFAFITGNLRNHWEEKLTEVTAKDALRECVNQIFAPGKDTAHVEVQPVSQILDPKQPPCYFISGDVEGAMEFVAVSTMYSQLKPGLEILGVLGVGRSSSRFTLRMSDPNSDLQTVHVGDDLPGMSKGAGILSLGPRLVKGFGERLGTHKTLLGELMENVKKTKGRPIIALKSGSLLMIAVEEYLREFLTSRPSLQIFPVKMKEDSKPIPLPTVLETHTLYLAGLNSRRTAVRLFASQIAQKPDFALGKSFQLPKIEVEDDQKYMALSVPFPITVARLCAMAAIEYGIPEVSFFRVFYEFVDAGSGVAKLIEFKEQIITKDFQEVGTNGCLHFFSSEDFCGSQSEEEGKELAAFEPGGARDALTEFIIRAQNIFLNNDRLVEEEATAHFGYAVEKIRQHVSWIISNFLEVERVMKPYALPSHSKQAYPPSGFASSLLSRAAQESFVEKLPIGQYMCHEESLYHAVAQQLQALRLIPRGGNDVHTAQSVQADLTVMRGPGRADLTEDENKWALECKALTEVYRMVTVHVFHARSAGSYQGATSVFGSGSKHIWLYKNKSWASLWTPPGPVVGQLEEMLAFLGDSGTDLSTLEAYAQLWRKIKVADYGVRCEVEMNILELIDRYCTDLLQEQAEMESVNVVDVTPKFYCPNQWELLRETLDQTLRLCGDADFRDVVCKGFGFPLWNAWRVSDRSRWPIAEWEAPMGRFWSLLRSSMSPERFLTFETQARDPPTLETVVVSDMSSPSVTVADFLVPSVPVSDVSSSSETVSEVSVTFHVNI